MRADVGFEEPVLPLLGQKTKMHEGRSYCEAFIRGAFVARAKRLVVLFI